MTIQEKIDEVVLAVQDALKECPIPEHDKDWILDGVKELGFQWQEANAHGRAACILLGLIDGNYPAHLKTQFIEECLQLKQLDELAQKEMTGSYYTFKTIPMPLYAGLIDLLMVQAIEGDAGVYNPRDQGEGHGDQAGADEEPKVVVEVVDRIPETGKTGRKNGPGVKTAEKIRKATNAPVKKTTARKKASGAADGK